MGKDNEKIKFVGLVNEKKYKRLLNQSIGTINIGKNEDFGMSAIEGMSAGKPAIVINDGGYLETCKDGFNSFVLNKNDIKNNLFKLLKNFNLNKSKRMEKNCLATAKKFNQKIFTKKINKLFI